MKYNSETEQKILLAASEVFLKKGRDGARMQEIADAAGINKALLHYYFRSKERLFRLVFRQELIDMLTNIFGIISTTDSFEVFLKKFISEYLVNVLLYIRVNPRYYGI